MKTHLGVPDPERLVERAGEFAEDGEIAPLSALAGHNVYLYSGKEHETVQRPVVNAAARFYALAGLDPGNLTLVLGDGGHAFMGTSNNGVFGFVSGVRCDCGSALPFLAAAFASSGCRLGRPWTQFGRQVAAIRSRLTIRRML